VNGLPKATKEGQKALEELLRTCVREVALLTACPPQTLADLALLQDAAHLRLAVAARKDLLTPALRDTLAAFGGTGQVPPAVPVLLEAAGLEAHDPRARGYAAYLRGRAEQEGGQPGAARVAFEAAAVFFRASGEPVCEATSSYQVGRLFYASGLHSRALVWFERALARRQSIPGGVPVRRGFPRPRCGGSSYGWQEGVTRRWDRTLRYAQSGRVAGFGQAHSSFAGSTSARPC
jgi:hypothetical protein